MYLLDYLLRRRKDLLYADEKVKEYLKNHEDIPWNLSIYKSGKRYRYVKVSDRTIPKERRARLYIKNSDKEQIIEIANRDYIREMQPLIKQEINALNIVIECITQKSAFDCFEDLYPGRKEYVTPILESDNEYAKRWIENRSGIGNSYPINGEIYTDNHVHVRSKSEKIIMDMLDRKKIPVKYEEALLVEGRYYFPDFTILDKCTRRVWYWEHFGKMDDPKYLKDAMEKIEMYARNGIILGYNLIITFETADHPLSVLTVESIIEKIIS